MRDVFSEKTTSANEFVTEGTIIITRSRSFSTLLRILTLFRRFLNKFTLQDLDSREFRPIRQRRRPAARYVCASNLSSRHIEIVYQENPVSK